MKSPFTNSAAVDAFAALHVPAFVIVCDVVDDSVATHCHFAAEVVPVLLTVPVPIAVLTGSLDWVNSVVFVLFAVPAPVPHPT